MYIEHASLRCDLAIIAQTAFNLIGIPAVIFEHPDMQGHVRRGAHPCGPKFEAIIIRWRRPLIITLDFALVILANYLAFWLRFDGDIPAEQRDLFVHMLPWLVLIRGVAFILFRLNEGLWRYTSLWDLQRIAGGVFTSTLVFYGWIHWGLGMAEYPRSVVIIDSILLIGFLVAVRLLSRVLRERLVWRQKKRVLIVGARDIGEKIVREMKTSPSLRYEPIGFIDEDPSLRGQRIHGVRVLGTRVDLARILAVERPHEVLLALPQSDPSTTRDIIARLESFKVPIKTLPRLTDWLDSKSAISQIRNVALEDLLPRAPVGAKPEAVRHMVVGRRVLITGAGGSIGSELCRQLAELEPDALILFERHENSLYKIASELVDRGYSSIVHPVIGDVTDAVRLHAVMKEFRPTIMFHAAAHKHVPLMELNAGEALKNNCIGTSIAAAAADQFEVERFVLISTDKAVNPSSVMGATKRVAELVVQEMARVSQTRFLTVRFGNVLGSNGSVVLRFQEQIEAGGPVTVTHPGVHRYFMLISEAVHLVLQAATLGEQGAIYLLDMGEPIKVLDLARNLIRLSGFVPDEEIPITFVGLRPGEKLHEELVGKGETAEPSPIDKILRIRTVATPEMAYLVQRLIKSEQPAVFKSSTLVIKRLTELVPTFRASGITASPPSTPTVRTA
jgi:FlaA1/EpsC-like NDP-sugar epimerase